MLNVVRGSRLIRSTSSIPSFTGRTLCARSSPAIPTGWCGKPRRKLDLAKAIESRAPPQVTIVSPASGAGSSDSTATIEARLTEQGGGIGNVEWRVNGVVLGLDRAGARSGSDLTLKKSLALVPGENRIEVVAYNTKGWIASDPATITINSTQPKIDEAATLVRAQRGREPIRQWAIADL